MTPGLTADDSIELSSSVEKWLNAGTEWNEHHGIIDRATIPPLFYHTKETSCASVGASMFDAANSRSSAGISVSSDSLIPTPALHPFLKLDTLESSCNENADALLGRTGSSSMVDSSSNHDDVSEHANSLLSTVLSVSRLHDRKLGLDETNLFMEADSPRGPLSPAALQLGKSQRTASIKRSYEEAFEAASGLAVAETQIIPTQKLSPKLQQKQPVLLLSRDGLRPPTAAEAGYSQFVAMGNSPNPVIPSTAFLPSSSNVGSGILFPTPLTLPLTLPNVPSVEEIAQSRPKRRNVRISNDPQSVAARHRRERISDRVRLLQHFIPGGTKMDTASMLDEAIHYVKYLQHHIQILERLTNRCEPRFVAPRLAHDSMLQGETTLCAHST